MPIEGRRLPCEPKRWTIQPTRTNAINAGANVTLCAFLLLHGLLQPGIETHLAGRICKLRPVWLNWPQPDGCA